MNRYILKSIQTHRKNISKKNEEQEEEKVIYDPVEEQRRISLSHQQYYEKEQEQELEQEQEQEQESVEKLIKLDTKTESVNLEKNEILHSDLTQKIINGIKKPRRKLK
jgi:hypothetical protein